MRKIETEMNAAIANRQDWRSGNTQVISSSFVTDVYLFGNLIARIGETWIELFDGKHQTATTKSRLNAILEGNGCPSEYIFQKDFKWFVNYNGGPIPFFSGMRLN